MNLLPTIEEEQGMIRKWVSVGGVEGMVEGNTYGVDGFTPEENSAILSQIHTEVATQLR